MADQIATAAIELLEKLIATPSFSREEGVTAQLIADWLTQHGFKVERSGNNVWAWTSQHAHLPNVLLNSHHDTVKPVAGWSEFSDPFVATWQGDKLFGLGSNDAGGPLVAMLATFAGLKNESLGFNLCMAATAEEEVSGSNGIASILAELGELNCGIVGEPTSLEAAVSEKGLVVLDGLAEGRSGHAARNEGENALYIALEDIETLRKFVFAKASPTLGEIRVTTTQIQAGTQHNVVPDKCSFVVDVRTTDAYTNEETVQLLQQQVKSKLTPRSLRLQPSGLSPKHALYKAAIDSLSLKPYGSPTLSDQALMPFPTLKLGPGDSARSHTAGEYIFRHEILSGIETYSKLLRSLSF